MNIGLGYGVHKARGKRIVDSIWQGIRIGCGKNNLGISITLLTGITSRVMDISLSLGRAVIRNITGCVMDIGLS